MRASRDTEMMLRRLMLGFFLLMLCGQLPHRTVAEEQARQALDLSGVWKLRLDPNDEGRRGRWFAETIDAAELQLPGSLQAQGHGNPVALDTPWTGGIADRSWFTEPQYEPYRQPDNIKIPFWLQPERHYIGAAWYQRTFEVPETWQGKRIVLFLERCHWASSVWVDEQEIGSQESLSTPHVYDLPRGLAPGTHRLTLCIDNRLQVGVGVNAHSVTDHTQSNWNGIIGRIELRQTDLIWIDDVQVYPDIERRTAQVHLKLGNLTGEPAEGKLSLRAESLEASTTDAPGENRIPLRIEAGASTNITVQYALGASSMTWDEFRPALYRLHVALQAETDAATCADASATTFGMREVTTSGTQLTINGRPIFLRGTLECCIFPLTGYPPTDVASWKRILERCRLHGLNHLRFHSWCPPEAAFVAADELGFYFQVECAAWANQGSSIGDGAPIDRFIQDEQQRILRAYGNHPSFLMLAYGNEPAGRNQNRFLGELVDHWKQTDPRRVYTGAAGWPVIPQNQYHNVPAPRIQAWGAGLRSRINARPPETMTDYRDFVQQHDVPVVSHEIGQWCVYPNLDEIPKYTGVLKPKNFEIFRDFLAAHHMADQAHDFLMASGRLQALCYKEEIESALRTPGFGGFQLLDLHDFPGQGTALVGILDPFWDSKPYVSPDEFRRFCNQTVPLARLEKRVWTTAEDLIAAIEVAHFGPSDLSEAVVYWRLEEPFDAGQRQAGKTLAGGQLSPKSLPTGQLTAVGDIQADLRNVAAPARLSLVVGIEGTPYENDWDLWVYPAKRRESSSDEILVTRELNDQVRQRLFGGGKVLWLLPPAAVKTGSVLGFSSIFWNTAWTRGQPPHTLGILCDPKHPALADFPTEYHSNWHWWYLVSQAAAMQLDDLPADLRPLVQVLDTWFEARRLGLVFEARVEGGSLLVCSIDLDRDAANPVAAQLKHSLLSYMAGESFKPSVSVAWDSLGGLKKPVPRLQRLGARLSADSQHPDYPAEQAIDGNPKTIWHTHWEPEPVAPPHHLLIDLREPATITGITYLPRQDMTNGRIAEFAVYVSNDADQWSEPVVRGKWPDGAAQQVVSFPAPQKARYIKLVALSEVSGKPFASAAEVDVLTE